MLALLIALVAFASATDYKPFQYTNCGSASDPIQLVDPTLAPSPVVFGQNVTGSVKMVVSKEINSAMAGTLTFKVQKHALVWVDIPCSAIPGGCTYPNFCEVAKVNNSTCTTLKSLGLPCGCPIAPGTYTINNLNEGPVPNPPSSLNWLADGSYKVSVQLNDKSGNSVLCAQIVDSVKK